MSDAVKGISRRTSLSVMSAGTLGMLAGPGRSEAAGAEAFALIGDRYHNSDYIRTALSKTLVRDAGVSIDFTDDYTLLNADTLGRYKLLIVFRDGMFWPDGYLGQYPGWNPRGNEAPESDPPVTGIGGDSQPWITPEQGMAVREFVSTAGRRFSIITPVTSRSTTMISLMSRARVSSDIRRFGDSGFGLSTTITRSRGA